MNMCLPERELNEKAVEELDYWKELRFFGGQPQAARKEDKHSLLEDVPVRKVLVLGQL